MTYTILKSTVANIPDFTTLVEAHAQEMRDWRAQMKLAAEHKNNSNIPEIERYVERPKPRAHLFIESAINEEGNPDFEIVDDGPTPDQVLAAKKSELLHRVSVREREAIATVIPVGKRRMFDLRENDIRVADQELAASLLPKPGLIATVASAVGISKSVDVMAEVEKRRPPKDTQYLCDQAERRRKCDAIERAAAQALHDIEELTLDNIDSWQMPDLETV